MRVLQVGWLHSCLSFLAMVLLTCLLEKSSMAFQEKAGNSSIAPIDAKLLLQRMRMQAVQIETNAVGGYVQRIYANRSDAEMATQLTSVRSALEKAKQSRISNDRKNNFKSDLAAMDREMEENFASLKKQLVSKQTGTTIAVRYFQQKHEYRVEQFDLNNDDPLDKLAFDLKSGKIKFAPTYTRTWNGKEYAELFLDNRSKETLIENAEVNQSHAALGNKNKEGNLVRFTRFGRDSADDPDTLLRLTKDGAAAVVEVTKVGTGEDAYVLKVGDPSSLAVYLEMVVLPGKGYCVESSKVKVGGIVMSREAYSEFDQTSAGFWLPKTIMREQHKLDQKQTPVLYSKEELIAFEPPKTNVVLEKGVFSLSESDEFKALPLSTRLHPKNN